MRFAVHGAAASGSGSGGGSGGDTEQLTARSDTEVTGQWIWPDLHGVAEQKKPGLTGFMQCLAAGQRC